jgi:hypothetical protein
MRATPRTLIATRPGRSNGAGSLVGTWGRYDRIGSWIAQGRQGRLAADADVGGQIG